VWYAAKPHIYVTGGLTADISEPEKSGDLHLPMSPNMFFKIFDPSCKLRFCHAIPIIFAKEISAVLIEFKQEQE
jgi:hypothetical protein